MAHSVPRKKPENVIPRPSKVKFSSETRKLSVLHHDYCFCLGQFKRALFKVTIGLFDSKSGYSDNWRSYVGCGLNVQDIIDQAKLQKDEYIVSVTFIARESKPD